MLALPLLGHGQTGKFAKCAQKDSPFTKYYACNTGIFACVLFPAILQHCCQYCNTSVNIAMFMCYLLQASCTE